MRRLLLHLVLLECCYLALTADQDADYWRRIGREELVRILARTPNTKVARNVILMVGDGMGTSTVMAARLLKGQLENRTGEDTQLAFEKFPYLAMSKVYTTDKQVPDSAATATAMLSGVKTKSKILGLDNTAQVGNCSTDIDKAKVTGMLHWAERKGMATGIVTTTRITHATPAASFAHTPHRDWEGDANIPHDVPACRDIAYQLVSDNPGIEVILGGGRRSFLPIDQPDPSTDKIDFNNQRHDGVDLIDKWKKDKLLKKKSYNYVWNKGQFDTVDPNNTDFLLGLFASSHMDFELDRDSGPSGQPSLAEMTSKAIKVLERRDKGYFLYVEGGRIDHAHHVNNAKRALYDTLAFEKAVEVAVNLTSESDTLLIVTADHSHVMTISGYPNRGNDILGLVKPFTQDNLGADGMPYTTLTYANGPSYKNYFRQNLTKVDVGADDYLQAAAVPMFYETHSGEDVAIYARGPMAHLVTGVQEQTYIAFVMAHAACVGDPGVACETGRGLLGSVSPGPDTAPPTPRTVPPCPTVQQTVSDTRGDHGNGAPGLASTGAVVLAFLCAVLVLNT